MKSFREFIQEWETLRQQTGTQYGSNPGGIHTDEDGQHHYVKYYRNEDHARSEVLAGKIHDHMGIQTTKAEYHNIDGKHAVVSQWNPNLKPKHPSHYEKLDAHQANQIGKMYHAAILTKNWDVVGLEHDNILHNRHTGDLYSMDHGGAFEYRAQGAKKEYGKDIDEHESLRYKGRPTGHVFGHAFEQHPEAEHHGIEAVRRMDDNHVHALFRDSGVSNWQHLHNSFMARKAALLQKYE